MDAARSNVRIFKYDSYSTGHYGKHKAPGITLQFTDVETGEPLYCIFNVELTRARTTKHGKKGALLPKGQFRPPKKGAFLGFWQRCGFDMPRRLGGLHDCIGKLRGIILTGSIHEKDKLANKTIKPLAMPDNHPTTTRQVPDNYPTNLPDNETDKAQIIRAFEEYSTKCADNYGKTVIREYGYTGASLETKKPEDQTWQEWLAEYEAANRL